VIGYWLVVGNAPTSQYPITGNVDDCLLVVNGVEYRWSFGAQECLPRQAPRIGSVALRPGARVTGLIAFEAPVGTAALVWRPREARDPAWVIETST